MQKPLGSIGEDHLERALQSRLLLFDNGLRDFVDFNVDDLVIVGDGTGIWLESPDDVSAFVGFTVCNQLSLLVALFITREKRSHPTRRFREEKGTKEGGNGENDLESDGETELGIVDYVAHAVVYFVRFVQVI